MKALLIGRGDECDIVLSDNSDLISRQHATLNLYPSGKITIVDQGRNGTYVNGIKITSNTPFPVTRNDVISFAHVRQLDWSLVPRNNAWMKYPILAFAALLLVTGTYFALNSSTRTPKQETSVTVADTITAKDTTAKDTAKADTAKIDSISQSRQKEKPNNKKKPNKDSQKDSTDSKKKTEDKKPENAKASNASKLPL